MKKLIYFTLALFIIGVASSCHPKADKLKEQQIADSLRKDSITKQKADSIAQVKADSVEKAKKEEEMNDAKIAFLRGIYTNVVYPSDMNMNPSMIEGYGNKLKKHLSPKVLKALTSYDDGIDDGWGTPQDNSPAFFLFGDGGDYGSEGPNFKYTYLGDNWFEVKIAHDVTIKVRVESEKEDDESFVVTGLVNKTYGIIVH